MKKFLMMICTFLLVFSAGMVTAGAAERYLSSEDARYFISFIYNSDTDKVTYDALEDDIFYKLLTGGYSSNPTYEEGAAAAFLSFMEAHIDQYLAKSGVAVKSSHEYLIEYFTKAAEEEAAGLAKEICKTNVTDSVIALCDGEDAYAIADGLTEATENPNKYFEELKLISSALTYAYGQNVTSLYTYFDAAKSCVYLKSTPGAYETAMSYNIMALKESNILSYASLLIPDMASWEIWIDKMDYWAEYVYDLKGRLESGSFEKTYVVVFSSNCDDVEDAVNWYASGELKAPKMERDGYILDGWYFDEDCTDGPIKDGYIVTENLVIYAKWIPRYFNITFHSNCPEIENYSYKLDRLNPEWIEPAMTRKGHIFSGWYWDSACNNPVSGEFEVTGDMEFYAKWICRFEYTPNNGEATITGIKYWETDEAGNRTRYVELPEYVDGYPVTNVKFSGWLNGVVTVVFPDNMEEIPAWALNYSVSLTNVVLGKNTKKIGESAFASCSKLTSITLNHGLEEIGDNAFASSKITEITIPDTVTKLGSCFSGCKVLENVTIPDSVEYMDGVFWGCSSLKSVNLGKGIISISDDCFYDCESLETINVSSESGSFASDNGVLYSKDKTVLYRYPAKKQEKQLILPASVIEIATQAFSGCLGLEYVKLPDSITQIPEKTFYGCTGLVTCVMPDTVNLIGEYAFSDCISLENINISKGVTQIGDCAFAGCEKLKRAVLPESATTLGSAVFSRCYALEGVALPNGITEIGSSMFYGCEKLEEINVPDELTYIGYGAFTCCKFKEFKIPETVTYIGPEAFSNCTNLESLVIPDGITCLNYYVIYGCKNLKYIVLPKSIDYIDYSNFSGGLTALENVYYMGTEEDWANVYVEEWDNDEFKPYLVRINPSVITEIAGVDSADNVTNGKIKFRKNDKGCDMYVAVFEDGRFMGADYVSVAANSTEEEFNIAGVLSENSSIKAFFWGVGDSSPEINAITYKE